MREEEVAEYDTWIALMWARALAWLADAGPGGVLLGLLLLAAALRGLLAMVRLLRLGVAIVSGSDTLWRHSASLGRVGCFATAQTKSTRHARSHPDDAR